MNVAIIEDHKIIGEALNNSISKLLKVKEIRLYFSSDSFLNSSNAWSPNLIISDLMMPGINGVDLIRSYKAKLGNEVKIIILTSHTNKTTIKQVISNGANGYLSKEGSLEELIKAIHLVFKGENYIGETLRDKEHSSEKVGYHLSPREKDVLNLICSGRIMKEVADDLGLSIHTAQSYHNNILRKFKVRRTSDLIVAAIRHGYYTP